MFAGEISGTGCTAWGASFAVNFNRQNKVPDNVVCPFDLGPYGGISFSYKSTRKSRMLVPTLQTASSDQSGGTCDPTLGQCDDSYQIELPVVAVWTSQVVRFDELEQLGFGQAFEFDPTQSIGVTFQIEPSATAMDAYDLAVDNISFVLK